MSQRFSNETKQRTLVRRNFGETSLVSIKYHDLYSFKEEVILLCQSILEMSLISHLHFSALFKVFLNSVLKK